MSAHTPQQLLEQIIQHCNKIYVAKKETSELAKLCTDLNDRLDNHPATLGKQADDASIEKELGEVQGQLKVWSKYGIVKSLKRRKEIEAGVARFARKLESIIPAQPAPTCTSNSCRVNASDGTGVGETSSPGRTNKDSAGAVNFTIGDATGGLPHEETAVPPIRKVKTTQVKRLDEEVTKQGGFLFSEGMHCEIWVGKWEKARSGEVIGKEGVDVEKVALKTLRMLRPQGKEREAHKRLESELLNWAELHHHNILPLYGSIMNSGRLYMVYPWRENGNLLTYVKSQPQSDKDHLLRGSAAGLSYLHSRGFVHGNVRCNNVLVTQEGDPQICDFGIGRIVQGDDASSVSTKAVSTKSGTSPTSIRYAAPEIIEDRATFATKHSDVFSFAMLIMECITEERPYSNLHRDTMVIYVRIAEEQRPLRPSGLDKRRCVSDELWDLMGRCWSREPGLRPTMEQVFRFFLNNA